MNRPSALFVTLTLAPFFALLGGCVMVEPTQPAPPGFACQQLRMHLRLTCESAAAQTAGQVAAIEEKGQQQFATQLGELSALPGRDFSVRGALLAKELVDGSVVILTEEGQKFAFGSMDQFRVWQNPGRLRYHVLSPRIIVSPWDNYHGRYRGGHYDYNRR